MDGRLQAIKHAASAACYTRTASLQKNVTLKRQEEGDARRHIRYCICRRGTCDCDDSCDSGRQTAARLSAAGFFCLFKLSHLSRFHSPPTATSNDAAYV